MQYEPDDMIGLGDLATTIAKARKGAKKFKAFLKRVKGKVKGRSVVAGGKRVSVDESGEVSVSPVDNAQVVPAGGVSAAGAMEWVKRNPLIVGVGALALVALFMRRKG